MGLRQGGYVIAEKGKSFAIGQRWISEMEPELGLGSVIKVEGRFISIEFRASDSVRQYAVSSAPIRRVRFNVGDRIKTRYGKEFEVTGSLEKEGLTTYHCGEILVPEQELSDSLSFTSPKERLFSGLADSNRAFNTRYLAHLLYANYLKSQARGFIGGRMELIPHQIYVAGEVAKRQIPRVLLSDEVGLGKTIEACLILHRLLNNGCIIRALILVPESLVHQWFVELYRRFNLLFRIYDRDYCESLAETNPAANIFQDEQLVLASIDFVANSKKWAEQCKSAGWDMLVVDEAHHLQEGQADYLFVEELAAQTKGLLLLTATPEQLGHKSHFARLKLLDPARFYDFERFEIEESKYLEIASLANKIINDEKLSAAEKKRLAGLLPHLKKSGDSFDREQIIADLLDRHGMGRIVFRNTRAAMPSFPERKAFLIPLNANNAIVQQTNSEYADGGHPPDYANDPRIEWLVGFIRQQRKTKILLICRTLEKVFAINKALQRKIQAKTALFHEDLTLLQRDRNAAWFSEPDGAQLLICSEIGSEGRNFQFTNTLVLFDLPEDPELLEQRIGRLDRIGQKKTIKIYLPFVRETAHEVLVRWYHDGLGAFEKNVPGVFQIYQQVREQLRICLENPLAVGIENLVKNTQEIRRRIVRQMEQGRDRLLELHSFNPEKAKEIVHSIKNFDQSVRLENFILAVFDGFSIHYRDLAKRTYNLDFRSISKPDFPFPPTHSERMTVTFDRVTALSREEIAFLSWDHPMVIGVFDVLLSSESGNCATGLIPDKDAQELLLEAIFIVECVAPRQLQVDRFLPPVPVRVVVNHSLNDLTLDYPTEKLYKLVKPGAKTLFENPDVKQYVQDMITKAEQVATVQMKSLSDKGLVEIESLIGNEIRRLQTLQKINPNIRPKEIDSWEKEKSALSKAVRNARLRLDALRVIYRGIST